MHIHKNDLEYYNSNAHTWWDKDSKLYSLYYFNKPRFEFFDNYVTSWQNLKVLDIGCGGGYTAEFMAAKGAIVSGIDQSLNSIQTAKQHAMTSQLEINYTCGNAENLPYESNSFDIVTCFDVLEHVTDLNKVIAEIHRVLKPNGLFLFDTINRTFKSRVIMIWFLENIIKEIERGVHDWQKFIKPQELLSLLSTNGFSDFMIKGFSFKGKNQKTGEIKVIINDDTSVTYIGKAVKAK